jgi:hypothetical protein
MTTMTIQFACVSEGVLLGTLQGMPGERVTAQSIREYFDAAPGQRDAGVEFRDSVQDNHVMLCPNCRGPVAVGDGDLPVAEVVEDRIMPVLGTFQFPPEGAQ